MKGLRMFLRPGVPAQITRHEHVIAFVDRQAESGAQKLRMLKVRAAANAACEEERMEVRSEFGRLFILDRFHVHHRETHFDVDGRITALVIEFK